jgi:hypothetical protein
MAQEASCKAQGVAALAKIEVLLRHIDDQLAAMRGGALPRRLLSYPSGDMDVARALAPLEEALPGSSRTPRLRSEERLGFGAKKVDLRWRLLGSLHVIWAGLVDMAPEHLEDRWGARRARRMRLRPGPPIESGRAGDGTRSISGAPGLP